jgi:glucoamylase
VIAAFDPEAKCEDSIFQPCSARALANLKAYVDSFRDLYTINKGIPSVLGVATGRYAEDVYYGGHPWYLTTLAVAEQLYDAIQQWSTIRELTISGVDLAFWKSVFPPAKTGTFKKGREFNMLLDAVLRYADSFVEVALKYTPSSGALSEQYSRQNGTQVSARDLTWSYASFVTMRSARLAATTEYAQVPSWDSWNGNTVPATCERGSVRGVYKPAIAAGAPPGSGGCTMLVTFNVNATTFYGENVYLLGNTSELGNWRPSDALPGTAIGYTEERPLWSFEVELPAKNTIQYAYIRKEPNGTVLFETKNRTLTLAECESEVFGNFTVEDAWQGPVGTPPARLF